MVASPALSTELFVMKKFDLLSKSEIRNIAIWNERIMWKCSWVYFLMNANYSIIYIGKSKDIKKRIKEHKERHNIYFTYFSYVEYYGNDRDLLDREWLYIRKYLDDWLENIRIDLMWIFIERWKWNKKLKTICNISTRKAREYTKWIPSFDLFWKKVVLRTHLKELLQELEKNDLAFVYDPDFI